MQTLLESLPESPNQAVLTWNEYNITLHAKHNNYCIEINDSKFYFDNVSDTLAKLQELIQMQKEFKEAFAKLTPSEHGYLSLISAS